MLRRRRPLLRAAAVGGTAYAVGRSTGRRRAEQQATDDYQNQQLAEMQDQQQGQQYAAPPQQQYAPPPQQYAAPAPAPAAAAPAGISDDELDQLQKLGEMHQQGILTDEEFAVAKQKILSHV